MKIENKKSEEIDWEDKVLLAVIFNDLEIYDKKIKPTCWKIDYGKTKEFIRSILAQQKEELIKDNPKGERQRIIEQIRAEERQNLKLELLSKLPKL